MDQPHFHIGEVWRWPSEPSTIRFIMRASTRDEVPLQKIEIVLKRPDNPGLFDFMMENCPPLDESTAPNYLEPPS
jgi:hypothetical protein